MSFSGNTENCEEVPTGKGKKEGGSDKEDENEKDEMLNDWVVVSGGRHEQGNDQ